MYSGALFTGIVILQLVLIHLTTVIGVIIHHAKSWLVLLAIPLTMILSLLNGFGALWGVLQPATDFNVTEKAKDIEPNNIQIDDD